MRLIICLLSHLTKKPQDVGPMAQSHIATAEPKPKPRWFTSTALNQPEWHLLIGILEDSWQRLCNLRASFLLFPITLSLPTSTRPSLVFPEKEAISHKWPPAAAAVKSLQSCTTLRPRRRQPTRLPCPWDSPGKNTGVGCHFLLQCMKVKSESEVAQLCPTLSDPMDCSPPGSSIHGIFQARVLEWGAIAFSVRWIYVTINGTRKKMKNIYQKLWEGLSQNT